MIEIRNQGRRPYYLDSTVKIELTTSRYPIPGAVERLEQGDKLVVAVGYDVAITLADDILSIRAL